MANTALNQLQEQLDAIRREAYEAGYAAAMQAIREFTGKSASGRDTAASPRASGRRPGRPAATPAAPAAPAAPQRQPRGANRAGSRAAGRSAARGGTRPQRGNNARMIEEILQASAPRALRPAEIRTVLQRDKGVAMAFTSIRHALGQLEGRKLAEQIADSKTWRYTGSSSAES